MKFYDILIDVQGKVEQLGTKEKFWFQDAEGHNLLFKLGRPNTGEHWAEVLIAEISHQLAIPHARYKFARFNKNIGVITPDIVQECAASRLILGNELLSQAIDDYPKAVSNPGKMYTLSNLYAVLKEKAATDQR